MGQWISFKKLENVLKKFEKIDGKFYNEPLEIIRIEQTEKHEKNSNRGKNGAKARWEKHKLSIAQASNKLSLDDSNREEEKREDKNRIEESESTHESELNFLYMVGEEEILSVPEFFKEKFQIHRNTLCSQHGELKINKWVEEFSVLHNQKTWKDMQDFRQHLSNFILKKSEYERTTTNKPVTTGKQPASTPGKL
jgi:hypothetical protein